MTLLFVSTSLPAPISSLVISLSPDAVLAAAGTKVYRFRRGKVDAVYDTVDHIMAAFDKPNGHMDEDDDDSSNSDSSSDADATEQQGTQLSSLLVFGDTIVALSSDGRHVFVWSVGTAELIRRIDLPDTFVASSVLHPATYLNKILIGSVDGQLALWNIRTGSLVHAYDTEQLRLAAAGPNPSAPRRPSSTSHSLPPSTSSPSALRTDTCFSTTSASMRASLPSTPLEVFRRAPSPSAPTASSTRSPSPPTPATSASLTSSRPPPPAQLGSEWPAPHLLDPGSARRRRRQHRVRAGSAASHLVWRRQQLQAVVL